VFEIFCSYDDQVLCASDFAWTLYNAYVQIDIKSYEYIGGRVERYGRKKKKIFVIAIIINEILPSLRVILSIKSLVVILVYKIVRASMYRRKMFFRIYMYTSFGTIG